VAHATDGSGPLPENLVALKGEREGFQVAFNNTTGGALKLGSRVTTDASLVGPQGAQQINFEVDRVGFVNVPQPSKGMNSAAGMYADPLPPLVSSKDAGRLSINAGEWGGVAVIAKVRTDAPAGTYGATLELFSGDEGPNEVVQARVPFTLTVGNTRLPQPGEKGTFKTVMNVEGEAYWLQHPDMRNKLPGTTAYGDRMAQVSGLMSFLDAHDVSPLEMPFGNPSASGPYNCAYASPHLGAKTYLSQLAERYFGKARDIDPSANQFPARMSPTHTNGCNPDSTTGGFVGTIDKLHTPGVKQDDVFDSTRAPRFYKSVAGAWSTHGFNRAGATYVKSPFDEPGEASNAQKRTMKFEVPKATKALHAAFGARAKVVLAGWPRDSRKTRKCRKAGFCTTIMGDGYDNRPQWDNRGSDDIDVWMPHFSRLWGRTTPAILNKYKIHRERDYANRLRSIRTRHKGGETWTYNFYTATKTMPQVTIDAPATDARLQYLMLARDGITGLFISNTMMGWGATPKLLPGTNVRRKGDPYDQALYFKHPIYGLAAGWGTFIYPGYVPSLGLDGETLRNSEGAVPVSSLRFEELRDGTEDANLIAAYRAAKGDAAVQAVLKSIFPGTYRPFPKTLGNVVGPVYNDGNNLAQRMEVARRTMIAALG
jgi:hypothetical protein